MDVETQDDLVCFSRVGKAYGQHVVLDNVDFSTKSGEFVVVVGRSGSGKSTLLKLAGALEPPDEGMVCFAGRRLDVMSERERSALRRRRIGFVFQFFNLIPTLTAGENVRLPLALNGFSRREAAGRVAALLAELELDGVDERFPEELSGGEQQRVAIARAVAHEPDLVLADEPTGNLDLETAQRVLALLNDTCRRRGATLLMATHSREVIGLADRMVTIRHARIEDAAT